MKKISIGTWAYSIGPYADCPVPFDVILEKLGALGFDGLELGGFGIHPNPDNLPTAEDRAKCKQSVADAGLAFSGLAANPASFSTGGTAFAPVPKPQPSVNRWVTPRSP